MPCAFRSTVVVCTSCCCCCALRARHYNNKQCRLAGSQAKGVGRQTGQGGRGAHRGLGVAPAGLEHCGFSLYVHFHVVFIAVFCSFRFHYTPRPVRPFQVPGNYNGQLQINRERERESFHSTLMSCDIFTT